MLMKRHYKKPDGWVPEFNEKGNCTNPPPLDHIELKHTGVSAEQNFSERLVNLAIAEGWMSIAKGVLTLHAKPEDLRYTIKRTPGYYCCHCEQRLADAGLPFEPGSSITVGMKHVLDAHKGEKSPDPSNPSGYMRSMQYDCMLASDQHQKFHNRKPKLEKGNKHHG